MALIPETCWRVVGASVRVSLTPAEVFGGSARRAASRRAFGSLLMRYDEGLGGVVVAQRGDLKFAKNALAPSNPASPFIHVVATARLLVFAPPKGIVLLGTVVHVGPDHVGMALLGTFHVVLRVGETGVGYAYDVVERMWAKEGELSIRVGDVVRFAVGEMCRTHAGIFHVAATLKGPDGKRRQELCVVPELKVEEEDVEEVDVMDEGDGEGDGDGSDEETAENAPPAYNPIKSLGSTANLFENDVFDDALDLEDTPAAIAKAKRKEAWKSTRKSAKKKERKSKESSRKKSGTKSGTKSGKKSGEKSGIKSQEEGKDKVTPSAKVEDQLADDAKGEDETCDAPAAGSSATAGKEKKNEDLLVDDAKVEDEVCDTPTADFGTTVAKKKKKKKESKEEEIEAKKEQVLATPLASKPPKSSEIDGVVSNLQSNGGSGPNASRKKRKRSLAKDGDDALGGYAGATSWSLTKNEKKRRRKLDGNAEDTKVEDSEVFLAAKKPTEIGASSSTASVKTDPDKLSKRERKLRKRRNSLAVRLDDLRFSEPTPKWA